MKVTLQIVLAPLKVEMDLVANLVTEDLAMPLRSVRCEDNEDDGDVRCMKDLNDQYQAAPGREGGELKYASK